MIEFDHHCGVFLINEEPEKVRDKPDVRFFAERNPGYVRGGRLSVMTELTWDNLRQFAKLPFRKGMEDGI